MFNEREDISEKKRAAAIKDMDEFIDSIVFPTDQDIEDNVRIRNELKNEFRGIVEKTTDPYFNIWDIFEDYQNRLIKKYGEPPEEEEKTNFNLVNSENSLMEEFLTLLYGPGESDKKASHRERLKKDLASKSTDDFEQETAKKIAALPPETRNRSLE